MQTAIVNLRTAKIQLLQLLDDRTPVEQFDVTGPFDFSDELKPLEDFRQIALDQRPDLRAALESVQQAQTNHKLAIANGSADPTFSTWYSYNPAFNNPIGPYARRQRQHSAAHLRPQPGREAAHPDRHRPQSATDRGRARAGLQRRGFGLRAGGEQHCPAQALQGAIQGSGAAGPRTVTYSYEHGGASLMDFLNAQSDYRAVQLAYLQLIGSYLTAAGQLNLAVGREVIQ